MALEYSKAFELIVGKVAEELEKNGYTRQKVAADTENELVSLITSENVAYAVVYIKDRQQMGLRTCGMTEEGPDNDWKTLATWLYDDVVCEKKDAESIANDFIEGVSGSVAIKRSKQMKQKKKKSDDGNADPKFLAKRFVPLFPELRDEICMEEDCYNPFRGATFAKEHIAPKLCEYVKRANGKELEKLGKLFDTQYGNGDVDTRAIITMVLLNALDDPEFNSLAEYFDVDLQKAAKAGRKYKCKEVKPEKPKKKTKSIASTLRDKIQ